MGNRIAVYGANYVAIIGRPNVGKSTLMNHLIGQKIAITSKKPQTTRNRIQTVYTCEKGQIVFLDTPGIHKAKNKLGEYMVAVAERTLKEVDAIMWLVEPSTFIGAGERHIAYTRDRHPSRGKSCGIAASGTVSCYFRAGQVLLRQVIRPRLRS